MLDKLRAVLELLRKQAAVEPRESMIPAAIAHIEAAIVKLEPLAKNATQI